MSGQALDESYRIVPADMHGCMARLAPPGSTTVHFALSGALTAYRAAGA